MGPRFKLAQAYVPIQRLDRLWPPEVGLMRGTIFPELYRPYRRKER
ncbi:MAG: spore coat associated protein CotJA [Firmicutes bacterium]|nr:spore coat associated protein CotJA [Bacillota bacterium]